MHTALRFGLWVGLVYAGLAAIVIVKDRKTHGGGWISLSGIVSYLVTFPVSVLAEKIGHRLNYQRNSHMLLAVLGTGLAVMLLAALLALPFTL